jgi:tetratricopeptide (TPR) repeat protein
MADRYHYLSSIGVAIMLAWGIPFLIKSEEIRKKILFPVAIAVLFIMAFLAWKQCGYWENSIVLYNHTLQVTKDNYLAYNNLGLALFEKGKIEEAIDHYNKAIRIAPDSAEVYNNRGIAYSYLGRQQQAIIDYDEAIRLKPDYFEAYNNRGNDYLIKGNNEVGCRDVQKACARGYCKALEWAKSKGYCH